MKNVFPHVFGVNHHQMFCAPPPFTEDVLFPTGSSRGTLFQFTITNSTVINAVPNPGCMPTQS